MSVTAPPRPKRTTKDLKTRSCVRSWQGAHELYEEEEGKFFHTKEYIFGDLPAASRTKATEEFNQHHETWDDHDTEYLVDWFKERAAEAGYDDADLGYSVGFCQGDHVNFRGCSADHKKLAARLLPFQAQHAEALVSWHGEDLWEMIELEFDYSSRGGDPRVSGSGIQERVLVGARLSYLTDGHDAVETKALIIPAPDELEEGLLEGDEIDRYETDMGRLVRYAGVQVGDYCGAFAEDLADAIEADMRDLAHDFYREFSDAILEAGSERAIAERLADDDFLTFRRDGTLIR